MERNIVCCNLYILVLALYQDRAYLHYALHVNYDVVSSGGIRKCVTEICINKKISRIYFSNKSCWFSTSTWVTRTHGCNIQRNVQTYNRGYTNYIFYIVWPRHNYCLRHSYRGKVLINSVIPDPMSWWPYIIFQKTNFIIWPQNQTYRYLK